MPRKRLKKWIIIIVVVYLAGGVALYLLQDAILFHPVQLNRSHRYDFKEPHRDLSIPIDNVDTLNLVQFQHQGDSAKGVVLYFHGNKKNIGWYARFTPHFTRHGYDVMMIDYPGFGKSTGKLTEKRLYEWARYLYRFARSQFSTDSIIVYGKSMGTGIAAWLASREKCSRLILETPYYDFPSVVKHYLPIYPVRKLLHYQLPTYKYIPYVEVPISIIHGTDDGVIPIRNARKLEPLLKPSDEFVVVPDASHNNLYKFRFVIEKIDSLMNL